MDSSTIMSQLSNADSDLGSAYCVTAGIRYVVSAIFTAIFVAILNNKVPGEMAKYIPQAALAAGLPQSSITDLFAAITAGTPAAMAKVPGITPAIESAVASATIVAETAAYRYVYYAAIAVALVGFLASLGLRDYDQYLTPHVARQVYKSEDAGKDVFELDDVDTKRTTV